ncbi:MAG: hypothetical protein WBZ29_14660 [Methanocella sp.]
MKDHKTSAYAQSELKETIEDIHTLSEMFNFHADQVAELTMFYAKKFRSDSGNFENERFYESVAAKFEKTPLNFHTTNGDSVRNAIKNKA